MIALSLGIFFAMWALATWLWGRDRFEPAFVFQTVWAITLIGVGFSGNYGYFGISMESALIFVCGAFGFSLGAALLKETISFSLESRPLTKQVESIDFRRLAFVCVGLHFLVVPIAISEIRSLADNAEDIFQLAFSLRIKATTGEDSVGPITGNYLLIGLMALPLLLVGYIKRSVGGILLLLNIIPWILLNLLIGGRAGLVSLIVASVYIYLSFGGRISTKVTVITLLLFSSVLVAGNVLVSKIDARIEDGIVPVLEQSLKGFFDYLFAGPILFSQWVSDPTMLVPTWDALIFPCQVLEKIGACTVPSIHQEFIAFNRQGDLGNVYSIFFSIFPKYGLIGLFVIMVFYGAAASYFHQRRNDSVFKTLVAAYLFVGVVLTVWSDGFGPNIYFFVKVFVFSMVVKLFVSGVSGRQPVS